MRVKREETKGSVVIMVGDEVSPATDAAYAAETVRLKNWIAANLPTDDAMIAVSAAVSFAGQLAVWRPSLRELISETFTAAAGAVDALGRDA